MMGSLMSPFAVARRPRRLIGREAEWKRLLHQIRTDGDELRVVIIRGPGGIGKTRMLEELQADLQVGQEAGARGHVVGTELIDLTDPRLHLRIPFLRALREALRWAQAFSPDFNFNTYDVAITEYERRVLEGVDYRLIQQAAHQALEAFWEDYTLLSKRRRILWILDTVEQLALSGSEWFLRNRLLSETQVQFQTSIWLLEAIRGHRLRNTTVILSGRDQEGKAFFERIEATAQEARVPIVSIELKPFGESEVGQFLEAIAEEWEETAAGAPEEQRERLHQIATSLRDLLSDKSKIRLLYQLTEGRPVRLALLADLVVEGRRIPHALQEPLPETPPPEELARRRWEVEGELVRTLFQILPSPEYRDQAKELTLRRDILLNLVRAPLGLTAEQLHYVMDNSQNLSPAEWQQQANPERIREIEAAMEDLQNLVLVKKRPPRLAIRNGESPQARLGLQDEIYRIFAEHMAPHVHPGKAIDPADEEDRKRLSQIWEGLSEEARERYRRNYEEEKKERRRLYAMLRDWAAWELEQLRAEHLRLIMREEQALEVELERMGPGMPRAAHLRLSDEDQERSVRYRQAIRELEQERMYYALLLNPDRELNEAYFDLADEFWRANDEDADIAAQELMWRVLNDRFALRFVEWGEPRAAVKRRGEHTLDTLRRAALQEMASRWIKRLALRREYQAARQFADRLEQFIEDRLSGSEKQSWQHTFARGERACWRAYARILPGHAQEIRDAIRDLEAIVKDLEKLANTPMGQPALEETGEEGFIGHPAEIRLKRVISVSLANIAYGYAQLRDLNEALRHYSRALHYIRETGAQAHRATILNNLSRILAELGRPEALTMALDALNLRWRIGAEDPIGLSHSTLALIYNRLNRPDRAWVEAAKAMVFFQRVNDPRGLGLAAIQLGEALRRLAVMGRISRTFPMAPEPLFRAAEEALSTALGIFLDHEPEAREREEGKVYEPVRRIEALLELGRLYRDRLIGIQRSERPREWQRAYNTALGLIHQVIQEARDRGWEHFLIEAQIDLAWTYYWALRETDAKDDLEEAINQAFHYIHEVGFRYIHSNQQLSMLNLLRARVALDQFLDWVQSRTREAWDRESRPHVDPRSIRRRIREEIGEEIRRESHGLKEAVEAILESLKLGRSINPCGPIMTLIKDTIYEYFKRFNQNELEALYFYIQQYSGHPEKETMESFLQDMIGFQIPHSNR